MFCENWQEQCDWDTTGMVPKRLGAPIMMALPPDREIAGSNPGSMGNVSGGKSEHTVDGDECVIYSLK